MEGLDYLKCIASKISPAELTNKYQSIGAEVDEFTDNGLGELAMVLGEVGAKLSDYQVTVGQDGEVYLCTPCLTNVDGVVSIFFNPDAVFPVPADAFLLNGKELEFGNGSIIVRKVEGCPKVLQYNQMTDYVKGKGSSFVKPDEVMNGESSITVELIDTDSKHVVTEVYDFMAYNVNVLIDGQRVCLSMSKTGYLSAQYFLATGKKTVRLVAKPYGTKGKVMYDFI